MRSCEIDPGLGASLTPSSPRAMPFSRATVHESSTEPSTGTRDLVIATVAHDLRTPLSAVYAALSFVLDDLLPQDDAHVLVRLHLGIARRAADQMIGLMSDLLDGTTMERGRLALRPTRCDCAEIVQAALAVLQPLAAQRGITLSSDHAPALPSILADPARLVRVFWNLGSNAIRFTPPGGRITFATSLDSHSVRFTVVDTGCGIAPQDLPYLFDRFWRGEGTSSGGVGLGLAIAKSIVEAHEGHFSVESTLGSGSSFSFTIPAAANGPDAPAPESLS
jgi:signal transduction histidine kinase